MDKLQSDHMACFTGVGRNSKGTVSISVDEWTRLNNVQTKCEALEKILEEYLQTGNAPAGSNLRERIMEMRLSRGTDTTLRAFCTTVHDRLDNIQWNRSREEAGLPCNRAHNWHGDVIGYTLDTQDMDLLAGDKKEGFGWMWEAGNYLLTHDSKVYLFL